MWHRYEFAGGGDGTWGDAPDLTASYATTQRCAAGAIVWITGVFSVWAWFWLSEVNIGVIFFTELRI